MSYYFFNKDERRVAAINHSQEMAKSFESEINASIDSTKVYNFNFKLNRDKHPICAATPSISIQTMDSVSSVVSQVKQNQGIKVAVLNFASYKYPGGMFLAGSSAQEESLCHASNLYNILTYFDGTYYEWNRHNLNNALYFNRGLYTPNVKFMYNDEVLSADVITVAAPNKGTAMRYGRISNEENSFCLRDRINFIIDIAEDNDVEILILGAFGCGVFKQDPNEVANLFKERCSKPSSIESYIFAIPPDGVNYPTFVKILS